MRINLLPENYRPQPQVRLLNLIILFAGIIAILGLSYFGYLAFSENQTLIAESNKLSMTLNSVQGVLAEAREKEALFAEVEALHQGINNVKVLYQDHGSIFRSLAAVMPRDIWLYDLQIGADGFVKMNGASLIFPQLGEFLGNINQLKQIKNARLIDIRQNKSDDVSYYKFSLEFETVRNSLGNTKI